jgi:Lrp/AsnC family leucine-responsive transcriptional regulator
MPGPIALDDTNWDILRLLQRDARMSWADLGREVGLTAPAVAERVRRMEQQGVIRGYRVDIDPARVGYGIIAYVRMDSEIPNVKRMADAVVGIPEVLELHQVTGTESFVLKVIVGSVEHLGVVIGKLLPYGRTTTSVVLETPFEERPIAGPPR